MDRYKVKIVVENLDGVCPLYKPGQVVSELNWWYFDEQKTMNLCSHALISMMTALIPFSRGISAKEMGFGKEDDVAFVQCPDPGEPYTCGGTVIFRLERTPLKDQ